MQGIICTNCREENSPEDLYCAQCGTPLPVVCVHCEKDNDRLLDACECCGQQRETRPLTTCRFCGQPLEDPLAQRAATPAKPK